MGGPDSGRGGNGRRAGRKDAIALAASTALGAGLAPFAPGTFGTLPAVALHLLAARLLPPPLLLPVLAALFLAACAASLRFAPWAVGHWGSADPKRFVLDEVAGYLLVVLLAPEGSSPAATAAWCFALFRLFDAAKPPPVGWIDRRFHGGWGILLDDLAAAAMAAALLRLLRLLASRGGGAAGWLPGLVE